MERTVLERIENLKAMMDRRESPELVKAEVRNIFDMLDKEQDITVKDKGMNAMFKVACDLMSEVDESPLMKLMEVLDKAKNLKGKITPVEVKVNQFLDATVIEVSQKVPYTKLMHIFNKAVKGFDENIKDLYCASYDKEDKLLHIDYKDNKHKSVVLDVTKWNLSEETIEVYIEGLVEYIAK